MLAEEGEGVWNGCEMEWNGEMDKRRNGKMTRSGTRM